MVVKKQQVAAFHLLDLLNGHLNDVSEVAFASFQAILVNVSSLKQGKKEFGWSSIVAIVKDLRLFKKWELSYLWGPENITGILSLLIALITASELW